MTQEQKDAIKLAGQTKYPSKGHEAAVKRVHFSWGCTHVINHAAQFGLVDSIKAENTRLREALEDIESNCDNQNPTHEVFWRIAKEALKQ